MSEAIHVIDLNIIPVQCGICDVEWEQARSAPSFGVARYEDQVVPDAYKGEWGGMQVCRPCFNAERRLHATRPGDFITFSEISEEGKR